MLWENLLYHIPSSSIISVKLDTSANTITVIRQNQPHPSLPQWVEDSRVKIVYGIVESTLREISRQRAHYIAPMPEQWLWEDDDEVHRDTSYWDWPKEHFTIDSTRVDSLTKAVIGDSVKVFPQDSSLHKIVKELLEKFGLDLDEFLEQTLNN